jgi:hypothetical protein
MSKQVKVEVTLVIEPFSLQEVL